MKFRKFLCFALIFAIMMSLGVTAFADAFMPVTESTAVKYVVSVYAE